MAVIADGVALAPVPRSPAYWTGVSRRFRRDPVAVGAGLVILTLILLALFAPDLGLADPYRSSM
jgi:peptide/nickel transport system permease protein